MSACGAERKCWYGALPAAIEGNAENICSSRAFLWLTLTGHIATDLPAAAKAISRRNLICKPKKNRRAHVSHYSGARVPVMHRGRGCERKSWVCFERGLVRGVSVSL